MLRPFLSLLALALVASPVACKKKGDDASESKSKSSKAAGDDGDDEGKGKGKKKKGDDEKASDDDEAPKGKAKKSCKAPEEALTADYTIPADCKLKVKSNIEVKEGATLTIEAGAKLSFEAGIRLNVEYGKLVAKGTEDAPITFTSSNSSPAAGDWEGIYFGDKTSAGNVLDHVVIEYAGKEGGYGKGALVFSGDVNAGRVAVTHSTFRNNEHCAVWNEKAKATFSKFEGNTLKDNGGTSLKLNPNVLGSIGANRFGEPVHLFADDVRASATWPKLDAGLIVDGRLNLAGTTKAAVITLADKTTFKFASGGSLHIGGADGGGLVGKGTVFTSANGTAAEGDWEGIYVEPKVTGTNLEDCTVEYAGKEGGYGKGAIVFYETTPKKAAKGFAMTGCKLRHNEHGSFSPGGEKDCGSLAKDNKSEDKPACITE